MRLNASELLYGLTLFFIWLMLPAIMFHSGLLFAVAFFTAILCGGLLLMIEVFR